MPAGAFLATVLGAPIALSPLWLAWVLWLSPLIDCLKNEPSAGNDKIVWVLVIFFTNMIGGILYLTIRRPARIAQYGR